MLRLVQVAPSHEEQNLSGVSHAQTLQIPLAQCYFLNSNAMVSRQDCLLRLVKVVHYENWSAAARTSCQDLLTQWYYPSSKVVGSR